MAVLAATIAYFAARHSASSNRKQAEQDREQRKISDRKDQWWARAEWALNQTVGANPELGYRVVNALRESEWADEHEADVIAAATEDALGSEILEDHDQGLANDDFRRPSTVDKGEERIDKEGGGPHA